MWSGAMRPMQPYAEAAGIDHVAPVLQLVVEGDDLWQTVQHRSIDLQKGRISRAPVVRHHALDRLGRGEMAGSEQQWIAGLRL